jgi:hypothetical protein
LKFENERDLTYREVVSLSDKQLVNYDKDQYGELYRNHILEQYKIYVEMADRVSQRRMTANSFFITINTSLLTVFGLFKSEMPFWWLLMPGIGLIVSFAWFSILHSYKQLNSAKFKVVHETEKLLPLALYDYEWVKLDNGKRMRTYWPLSHIEKIIPVLFAIIYMLIVAAKLLF